jgi:hypothetical protein
MTKPKNHKPPKTKTVQKASGMKHAAALLGVTTGVMKRARRECPQAFDSHNRVIIPVVQQWLREISGASPNDQAKSDMTAADRFRTLLLAQLRAMLAIGKACEVYRSSMAEMIELWESCEKDGCFPGLRIPTGPAGKNLGIATAAFLKLEREALKLDGAWCDLDEAWNFSGYFSDDEPS